MNAFWLNGDAVEYAMQLEMSVKPLGSWLASMPTVAKIATIATLVAEIATLFLMFIPRLHHFNRGVLLGFFLILHVSIWMSMSIGLFSITAIVAWTVFIPGDIWNTWLGEPVGFSQRRFYRGRFRILDRAVEIIAIVFLVAITLQNIVGMMGPDTAKRFSTVELFGRSTMTVQQFHMFAKPPLYSPWFEYNAQLESGKVVDVFDDRRRDTQLKPDSIYNYMQTQIWRRIHWNLITHPVYPPETEMLYADIRHRLLESLVNRWDSKVFTDPVSKAQLVCHLEPIKLDRNESESHVFANHKKFDLIWAEYDRSGPNE